MQDWIQTDLQPEQDTVGPQGKIFGAFAGTAVIAGLRIKAKQEKAMIIKNDFRYPPSGAIRRLHIYLPDDYDDTDETYPVMYFFDGHNLFFDSDATYGKSWGLKEFLDGWDKKMIIVGMECGHNGNERLWEYSPYRASRGMFSEHEPMGDATMQWIVNDVKPMIDREFRTYPNRECTGIGGSSMGGLMALYGLVRYNDVFSKGACVSSALGFCQPKVMIEMNNDPVSPDTRAFLSWGTGEAPGVQDVNAIDCHSGTYRRNKAVANKFEKQGAAAQLYCQVGGHHCEADWEKQVPFFMNWLWK